LVTRREGSGAVAQWSAVLAGPLIAFTGQQILYILNEKACPGEGLHWTLHAVAVVLIAAVVGVGIMAWRIWQNSVVGDPSEGGPAANSYFLGVVGVGSAALSVLLIIAMWLPVLYFHSCDRA
jgi:hypothetical protein